MIRRVWLDQALARAYSTVMDIDIGKKVKELRNTAGLSIKDLAAKADVSTGLISQIERNLVVPSVTVLYRIAMSLGASVGYFFGEGPAVRNDPVVRQSERKRLSIDGINGIYELLSSSASKRLEFIHITLKGRESSRMDMISHEGEECGYVLKGHMLIKLGQEEYYLGEGDSMTFDSSIPHRYLNIDDVECVSIWAMTPPSF